jgi:head-tail adaptor
MRVDTSRFRTRVQFDRLNVARGASGGMQRSWVPIGARWCEVQHRTGSIQPATDSSGGTAPRSSVQVATWFDAAIAEQCGFVLAGVRYVISHIDNVGQEGVHMVITAEREVRNA